MIAALFFMPVTMMVAAWAAQPSDRSFLVRAVLLTWVLSLPMLYIVNDALPFTGGGDDEIYFSLGGTPIYSWSDVFDLTRFSEDIEQPGFPWLLTIENYFTGQDLLAFKLLNFSIFIMLAMIWYRIGNQLEGPSFGRALAITTLILTPLWYYVCFLLKDLVITLLQSIFLLCLVSSAKRKSIWPWLVMAGATVALLPFRTPSVMINAAALVGAIMLRTVAGKLGGARSIQLVLAGGFVAALLYYAGNPEVLASFGVFMEHRAVGSEAMFETAEKLRAETVMNPVTFPLIYLLSETAGLNPQSWDNFDSSWFRGVLAIPWIFFVVPFFLIGILWLARPLSDGQRWLGFFGRLRNSRLVASPWGALIAFVIAYIGVSWQLNDTTRWRVPDMPVIAAIATAGWLYSSRSTRIAVLYLAVPTGTAIIAVFYLLRG